MESEAYAVETLVLKITEGSERAIEIAADLLKKGELVAFPTETVYGLGAIATNEKAVQKIFTVKGRPQDNPLIVHVSSIEMALPFVAAPKETFVFLAERYWPGPLTLVVEHTGVLPKIVTAGLSTAAIRMPAHPVALQLIETAGEPIVAPSANRSGRPSPTRAEHVLDDLGGEIAAIIDAGPTQIGIESTVLLLTTSPPRILRPGAITKSDLEKCLGVEIVEDLLPPDTNHLTPIAPGTKYRHYAPQLPIFLFSEEAHVIAKAAEDQRMNREKILLLVSATQLPKFRSLFHPRIHIAEVTEATVYEHFRQAEKQGFTQIWIFVDHDIRKRSGLFNRILKAAGVTSVDKTVQGDKSDQRAETL